MPGAEPVLWCWVYRRGSAELSALQEVSCIDNIEDVIDSTTVQHVIADLSALHEISYIDNIEDVIDSTTIPHVIAELSALQEISCIDIKYVIDSKLSDKR